MKPPSRRPVEPAKTSTEKDTDADEPSIVDDVEEAVAHQQPPKKTYLQTLRLYSGTYTREPVLKIFVRPVLLLLLPPVFWAALVEAVSIGFFVAVTSNVAVAFGEAYHFNSWQTGLCFVSAVIGAVLAIIFGGVISDKVADFFTARNNNIREPEMRLPAIIFALLLSPTGLILYGVSIENNLHWIAPTIALGMCKFLRHGSPNVQMSNVCCTVMFALVQSNNITIVYTVDSYFPVVGEVLVSQFAFKCMYLSISLDRRLTAVDSLLRLPALLLHKPLDREIRVQCGIWGDGRHFRGCDAYGDTSLCLGQEDPPIVAALGRHETDPVERGQRCGRMSMRVGFQTNDPMPQARGTFSRSSVSWVTNC